MGLQPESPMNLLQVRRILDDFVLQPQDDPDDVSTFVEHALQCVTSSPDEFPHPDRLVELLRAVVAIMSEWNWQAEPPLPQLADDESWWSHPAWDSVKEALAAANALLPPIGDGERDELDRQATRRA